jgi:hypothetical protein
MASVFTRLAPIATLLGIVAGTERVDGLILGPREITHSLFSPG